MNAFKNYTIAVLFVAVLILGAICVNSCSGNRDMDIRTGELATENERITSESNRLAEEVRELTGRLSEANSELESITEGFADIDSGLSEIGDGIQGVIVRMREYIEEPE